MILPLRLITEVDQPIFGSNIYNLAKLCADDQFNIPEAIAISPPEFILKVVLKHFEYQDKDRFEESLTLIKQEILKIPILPELEVELKDQSHFFLQGQTKVKKDLWPTLLFIWID